MLRNLAVFLFVMFSYSCVLAGEATYEKEFVVKSKMEVVSKWLKDHPKEIAAATDSQFISRVGDKIRIKQDTPDGLFDFTSVETFKESPTVHEYKSKLVQVHTGTLDGQETEIRLESVGHGTKVFVRFYASLPDRKGVVIRPRLRKSGIGLQNMIERKFR